MCARDDQTLSFLEVNPRLGANFKIAEACGLPLSTLSVALPEGESVELHPDPWSYKTGVRYAWTKGAISGALKAKRAGEAGLAGTLELLIQSMHEALSPCHLSFELTDPLPTLGSYANIFAGRLMAKRVADRLVSPHKV